MRLLSMWLIKKIERSHLSIFHSGMNRLAYQRERILWRSCIVMVKMCMQQACMIGILHDQIIWNMGLTKFAVNCEVCTSTTAQETSECIGGTNKDDDIHGQMKMMKYNLLKMKMVRMFCMYVG